MSKIAKKLGDVKTHRSMREAFVNENGAIDLASIMVGIIVIGIIGGVIAATVFAVIPWSQDNAAKANLGAVRTAESAYSGFQAEAGKASFGDSDKLASNANGQLLAKAATLSVTTSTDGSCYLAVSKSATGKIFYQTDTSNVQTYSKGAAPSCGTASDLATAAGDNTPAAVAGYGTLAETGHVAGGKGYTGFSHTQFFAAGPGKPSQYTSVPAISSLTGKNLNTTFAVNSGDVSLVGVNGVTTVLNGAGKFTLTTDSSGDVSSIALTPTNASVGFVRVSDPNGIYFQDTKAPFAMDPFLYLANGDESSTPPVIHFKVNGVDNFLPYVSDGA